MTRTVVGSTPTPAAILADVHKYVIRGTLGPKTQPRRGGGDTGNTLVTGDRDPLILDGAGIDVQAARLCPDHGTTLDGQKCSHGHVAEWWRVLVNGRIQYGGRKFSSVED